MISPVSHLVQLVENVAQVFELAVPLPRPIQLTEDLSHKTSSDFFYRLIWGAAPLGSSM